MRSSAPPHRAEGTRSGQPGKTIIAAASAAVVTVSTVASSRTWHPPLVGREHRRASLRHRLRARPDGARLGPEGQDARTCSGRSAVWRIRSDGSSPPRALKAIELLRTRHRTLMAGWSGVAQAFKGFGAPFNRMGRVAFAREAVTRHDGAVPPSARADVRGLAEFIRG